MVSMPTPTREHRVRRNAIVYAIGMIASRLVSFIMLPVYTHQLSTADYGLLSLLQLVTDIVAIVSTAGAASGLMRFYFKAPDEAHRRQLASTAFLLVSLLGVVGSILLAVNANWVWIHFLDGAGSLTLLYICAATFFFDSLVTVPLAVLQAEGRAGIYSGVLLAKLLIQLSLNIFFLMVLDKGVAGVLTSGLVASALTGTVLAFWLWRRTGFSWSSEAAKDLRRFGVPFQLVTAGTFVLAFGDRIFLQKYQGRAEVGLYSLAYQFGFLLTGSGAAPYIRAWLPSRYHQLSLPEAERTIADNRGFLELSLICVTLAVGMSVFVAPVLRIMAAPEYGDAAKYVPIILLAYLFQVWADVVSFGLQAAEKTKWITVATWISVATILVLYVVLIPRYGAMGAAVATLLSFIVRFIAQYSFSQRFRPMKYDWFPQVNLMITGYGVVAITYAIKPSTLLSQIAVGTLAVIVYSVVVWIGVLDDHERGRLRGLALNLLSKVWPLQNLRGAA